MQIRDYWLVLSKRWWLILLVAFAASVSSYLFSHFQTPIYRSEVVLTVQPSTLDYGLTLVVGNMLTQYQQQLLTRQLAQQVDDDLKLDLPVDKLLSEVKVSAVTNGYLLDITVDDTDPNRAHDVALTWANDFIQKHQADMAPLDPKDRIGIEMLDRPQPGQLFFPKTKQYVLAAGVLGLVVGAVLVFLIEYRDDTLKTFDDVERVTSLPVVGAIPHASSLAMAGAPADGRTGSARKGGRRWPLIRPTS